MQLPKMLDTALSFIWWPEAVGDRDWRKRCRWPFPCARATHDRPTADPRELTADRNFQDSYTSGINAAAILLVYCAAVRRYGGSSCSIWIIFVLLCGIIIMQLSQQKDLTRTVLILYTMLSPVSVWAFNWRIEGRRKLRFGGKSFPASCNWRCNFNKG